MNGEDGKYSSHLTKQVIDPSNNKKTDILVDYVESDSTVPTQIVSCEITCKSEFSFDKAFGGVMQNTEDPNDQKLLTRDSSILLKLEQQESAEQINNMIEEINYISHDTKLQYNDKSNDLNLNKSSVSDSIINHAFEDFMNLENETLKMTVEYPAVEIKQTKLLNEVKQPILREAEVYLKSNLKDPNIKSSLDTITNNLQTSEDNNYVNTTKQLLNETLEATNEEIEQVGTAEDFLELHGDEKIINESFDANCKTNEESSLNFIKERGSTDSYSEEVKVTTECKQLKSVPENSQIKVMNVEEVWETSEHMNYTKVVSQIPKVVAEINESPQDINEKPVTEFEDYKESEFLKDEERKSQVKILNTKDYVIPNEDEDIKVINDLSDQIGKTNKVSESINDEIDSVVKEDDTKLTNFAYENVQVDDFVGEIQQETDLDVIINVEGYKVPEISKTVDEKSPISISNNEDGWGEKDSTKVLSDSSDALGKMNADENQGINQDIKEHNIKLANVPYENINVEITSEEVQKETAHDVVVEMDNYASTEPANNGIENPQINVMNTEDVWETNENINYMDVVNQSPQLVNKSSLNDKQDEGKKDSTTENEEGGEILEYNNTEMNVIGTAEPALISQSYDKKMPEEEIILAENYKSNSKKLDEDNIQKIDSIQEMKAEEMVDGSSIIIKVLDVDKNEEAFISEVEVFVEEVVKESHSIFESEIIFSHSVTTQNISIEHEMTGKEEFVEYKDEGINLALSSTTGAISQSQDQQDQTKGIILGEIYHGRLNNEFEAEKIMSVEIETPDYYSTSCKSLEELHEFNAINKSPIVIDAIDLDSNFESMLMQIEAFVEDVVNESLLILGKEMITLNSVNSKNDDTDNVSFYETDNVTDNVTENDSEVGSSNYDTAPECTNTNYRRISSSFCNKENFVKNNSETSEKTVKRSNLESRNFIIEIESVLNDSNYCSPQSMDELDELSKYSSTGAEKCGVNDLQYKSNLIAQNFLKYHKNLISKINFKNMKASQLLKNGKKSNYLIPNFASKPLKSNLNDSMFYSEIEVEFLDSKIDNVIKLDLDSNDTLMKPIKYNHNNTIITSLPLDIETFVNLENYLDKSTFNMDNNNIHNNEPALIRNDLLSIYKKQLTTLIQTTQHNGIGYENVIHDYIECLISENGFNNFYYNANIKTMPGLYNVGVMIESINISPMIRIKVIKKRNMENISYNQLTIETAEEINSIFEMIESGLSDEAKRDEFSLFSCSKKYHETDVSSFLIVEIPGNAFKMDVVKDKTVSKEESKIFLNHGSHETIEVISANSKHFGDTFYEVEWCDCMNSLDFTDETTDVNTSNSNTMDSNEDNLHRTISRTRSTLKNRKKYLEILNNMSLFYRATSFGDKVDRNKKYLKKSLTSSSSSSSSSKLSNIPYGNYQRHHQSVNDMPKYLVKNTECSQNCQEVSYLTNLPKRLPQDLKLFTHRIIESNEKKSTNSMKQESYVESLKTKLVKKNIINGNTLQSVNDKSNIQTPEQIYRYKNNLSSDSLILCNLDKSDNVTAATSVTQNYNLSENTIFKCISDLSNEVNNDLRKTKCDKTIASNLSFRSSDRTSDFLESKITKPSNKELISSEQMDYDFNQTDLKKITKLFFQNNESQSELESLSILDDDTIIYCPNAIRTTHVDIINITHSNEKLMIDLLAYSFPNYLRSSLRQVYYRIVSNCHSLSTLTKTGNEIQLYRSHERFYPLFQETISCFNSTKKKNSFLSPDIPRKQLKIQFHDESESSHNLVSNLTHFLFTASRVIFIEVTCDDYIPMEYDIFQLIPIRNHNCHPPVSQSSLLTIHATITIHTDLSIIFLMVYQDFEKLPLKILFKSKVSTIDHNYQTSTYFTAFTLSKTELINTINYPTDNQIISVMTRRKNSKLIQQTSFSLTNQISNPLETVLFDFSSLQSFQMKKTKIKSCCNSIKTKMAVVVNEKPEYVKWYRIIESKIIQNFDTKHPSIKQMNESQTYSNSVNLIKTIASLKRRLKKLSPATKLELSNKVRKTKNKKLTDSTITAAYSKLDSYRLRLIDDMKVFKNTNSNKSQFKTPQNPILLYDQDRMRGSNMKNSCDKCGKLFSFMSHLNQHQCICYKRN